MKTTSLILSVLLLLSPVVLRAHCQVPCGIFGDERVFSEVSEHIDTVKKAMVKIEELSAAEKMNANQLVRWVTNKEKHAKAIQQIMLDYFLAQRVKKGSDHYEEKLVLIHEVIVAAMKTKQTTGVAAIEPLTKSLAKFKGLYLDHKH